MDTLWTRRSNTSKLSLSTGAPTTNGAGSTTDHPTRTYNAGRKNGDSSSHSNRNPFTAVPASAGSISSPTAGASGAFALGTGAFASFGASKTSKTQSGGLDYGSLNKAPTAEKLAKDLGSRPSKTSLAGSKSATPPPTHSLRTGWVFWFRPPITKSNGFVEYEKTLHPMAEANTAEDLFKVYRHMKRPSTLPLVSDYHIFKKGIRPIWEDDDNKKGGKWIVRLKKGVADRYWEELIFAIAGNQFAEASDEVCGAVLSVRNGEDILSIWTRNDGGRVLRIRETMKRILSFPPETKVEWKSHDSSIQQRTAIDEQRKEKSNQHHHPSTNPRNGSKDHNDHPSSSSDKRQSS